MHKGYHLSYFVSKNVSRAIDIEFGSNQGQLEDKRLKATTLINGSYPYLVIKED